MKPVPSKAQIRSELENQIEDFLREGGTVEAVPRGQSGHLDNINPFTNQPQSPPSSQSRTPLNDVVKALDERKKTKPLAGRLKRPRKKLITDDFGEPLRWVWVED